MTVKNICQQTRQTVSSITIIDLTGISRIEEAFAVVLAAAAVALYVSLILSERRHEQATMAAVGQSLRGIADYVWSEVLLVVSFGVLLALPLGLALSYSGAAAAVIVLGTVAARHSLRRLPLGQILCEQIVPGPHLARRSDN